MTTPELLPCPFCGGHAAYQVGFGVICQRCEVGMPSTLDDAARAWNTRAPLSPAVLAELPEVKALVAALEQIRSRPNAMMWGEDHEKAEAMRDMENAADAAILAFAAAIREGRG